MSGAGQLTLPRHEMRSRICSAPASSTPEFEMEPLAVGNSSDDTCDVDHIEEDDTFNDDSFETTERRAPSIGYLAQYFAVGLIYGGLPSTGESRRI